MPLGSWPLLSLFLPTFHFIGVEETYEKDLGFVEK